LTPMNINENFRNWCDVVLAQVRFWPDHTPIRRELEAHYEDHMKDLERIGYDWELAQERALAAMGDAEEVGRAMNKAHRPWLGWFWEASIVVLVSAIMLFVVSFGESEVPQRLKNSIWPPEDPGGYEDTYRIINDSGVFEHMGSYTAEGPVRWGDYTLSLVKGNWWYGNGFYRGHCLFRIEEDGGVWFDMPDDIMNDFQMVADTGQEYINNGYYADLYSRKDYVEGMEDHTFTIYRANSFKLVPGTTDSWSSEPCENLRGGYLMMQLTAHEVPEWTEISYPYAGNEGALRICWEVAS